MADTVRVKISSDAAGSISVTPVVVQEMTLFELLEYALAAVGKDAARVRDLLSRGSMVNGASRLRWAGLHLSEEEIEALLRQFPDSEPGRPMETARCVAVVLRSGLHAIPIPREAAAKKKLLRRRSFWDVLQPLALSAGYVEYSYREKADIYRTALPAGMQAQMREAGSLLPYSTLARQLATVPIDAVEFHVKR